MKQTMMDETLRGVDVSVYQGQIDWRAVKASGIRFAMIKATQGRSVSDPTLVNFTDSRFAENALGAAKVGIVCGAYLTALNETEAVQEAKVFLSAVAPYRTSLALGAALDVEDSRLPRDKAKLTAIVRAFCRYVTDAGMSCMVYTNPDFLQNRLGDLTEFGLWLALWRDKTNLPTTKQYPNLKLWQWGTEAVSGIAGKTDANLGITGLLDVRREPVDCAAEVQRRAGLSDVTMQFLSLYRFGDDLIRKLYEAMVKQEDNR